MTIRDERAATWENHESLKTIVSLQAQVDALTRERDEARAKLFPYADDKQISGMSWGGYYLIGNDKSIKELRRIESDAAQIEVFRAAFNERTEAAEAEVTRLRAQVKGLEDALKEAVSVLEALDDTGVLMASPVPVSSELRARAFALSDTHPWVRAALTKGDTNG